MGNVLDFLEDTMLAAAARGSIPRKLLAGRDDLFDFPFLIKSSPKRKSDSTDDEDAAIWGYGLPTIGNGVHLRDLTCRVSSMDYMTMGVCDSIDWGPVTFTSAYTSSPVTLPLEPDYLWLSHVLPEGAVTGKDQYWKLPAKTDQSWEMIFGYEFPQFDKIGDPLPMPKTLKQYFGDRGAERSSRVAVSPPGLQQSNTLRIGPLRILVVVTLICCKQRYDFDPGGGLGAGRFFPMIMVVSNHDLKTVTGKVTIARPPQVKMIPDDPAQANKHCHSDPQGATVMMDSEEMTKDLGVAFFTDSNKSFRGLIPPPDWGTLFDYYDVSPPPGPYVCAVPWKDRSRRTVPGAEVVRTDPPFYTREKDGWAGPPDDDPPSNRPPVSVRREKIMKAAGQGEFDNLHIAPKMVVRPEFVTSTRVPKEKLIGLDKITMAPFCFHDCMHMHVRWGADFSDAQNRGWVNDETPNALAGAPLVPPNQKVILNLLSSTSFEYIAEAQGVRAGTWQIMLHHGASYALNTKFKLNGVFLLDWGNDVSVSRGDWALMYWILRWFTASDGVQYERLSWAEGSLPKLREAGSLPENAPKAAASASGN
jgi:hypothetical protein